MGKKKIHTEEEATLQSLVGPSTYGVWVDMLKILVPGGRTHRLAPLVAGMLQYAAERAGQRSRGGPRHGSVTAALLNAREDEEDGMPAGDLAKLVERLFQDARVKSKRVDRRGERYSVVEAAIQEFVRWNSMPWEQE